MSAQILQFPVNLSVLYDVRTVRRIAERAGLNAREEVNRFVRSGYSRAYLAELSERARQARMAGAPYPEGAA